MFDQVFESLHKAADSALGMQQELFKKWLGLWPGVMTSPVGFGEPIKLQKKWVEVVGEMVKKERESLEAQFSAGLRQIEEAFRLAEAKDPQELRARTIQLWQKTFECLRQTYEAQLRDFQAAVTRWTELVMKGGAA